MSAEVFLDTNILIYAISGDDPRAEIAERLLNEGGVVSVQVLNEFAAAARRKLRRSWAEISEALQAVRVLCPAPITLTVEIHERALVIAEQDGVGVYDALIIAAAMEAGCATLYSEDLQAGRVFAGKLTIRNPFAS